MRNILRAGLGLAVVTAGLAAVPAQAGTGCNGVINPFVWFCAPWDNNNGPQFPYAKKKSQAVPAGTPVKQQNGVWLAQVNGGWAPLVASGGGNLVASGAGNLVASGGGNVWVQ